jgi:hypothetical protein
MSRDQWAQLVHFVGERVPCFEYPGDGSAGDHKINERGAADRRRESDDADHQRAEHFMPLGQERFRQTGGMGRLQ